MSLLPLSFPEVCHDQLESCATQLEALESWIGKLPLAHPSASQEKLAQLMSELNQLRLQPLRRQEWLNVLQPVIQQVLSELDRHHDPQSRPLAQALQNLQAQGYKRVINDLLELRGQLPPPLLAKALLQSLHTALGCLGALIFRSCRFSISAPSECWPELNLLYYIACQSHLQHKQVQLAAPQNCEQAYLQWVLLGLIHPESLRSDELERLLPHLALWSKQLALWSKQQLPLPPANQNGLFQVLAKNNYQPSRAAVLIETTTDRELGLDTRDITTTLFTELQQGESALGNRLIQHLLASLGEASERMLPRVDASGSVFLVLGLRSVHFHLNQRRPFESLVAGENLSVQPKENPFLQQQQLDPWAGAHDAAENTSTGYIELIEIDHNLSTSLEQELNKRHPQYDLQLVNTSATGYCLYWPGKAPPLLRTGELVALKEKAANPWQLGLIRWIKEVADGHQLGIERLGSRMQPCAIKPIIKVGEPVAYMPGFFIPELRVLGIAASVITPLLPFREGQKVSISQEKGVQRARLAQLMSSPGEFNQFRLEPLGQESLSLH